MESIIVIALLSGLIAAIFFKTNMLHVLGMLSLGWVMVTLTNSEAILYARSLDPFGTGNIDLVTSLILAFLPAGLTIVFTKGSTKKNLRRFLGVLLVPASFLIGWMSILLSVNYDQRVSLLGSKTNQLIQANQSYILWATAIVALIYIYITRPKQPKEDKKK